VGAYLINQVQNVMAIAASLNVPLNIIHSEVINIDFKNNCVVTSDGKFYKSNIVMICTGTYIRNDYPHLL